MHSNSSAKRHFIFGFALSLVLAALLLFPGIGSFGFFEPHETDRADRAMASSRGNSPNDRSPPKETRAGKIEERIVGLAFRLKGAAGSNVERTARIPLAILGLLAVAVFFLFVSAIAHPRLATFASIALVCCPLFIFHARQITSGLPILLAEILGVGGLVVAATSRSINRVVTGSVAAALGLLMGVFEGGFLMGIGAPAATVSLALAMDNGDGGKREGLADRKFWVSMGAGVLALVGAGTFLSVVTLSRSEIPLVTGGHLTAVAAKNSFEKPLELLAYGWFPWSGVAAFALLGYFGRRKNDKSMVPPLFRHLVVTGIAIGCAAYVVDAHFTGPSPLFLALPMALATAIVVEDLRTRSVPGVLFCLGACLVMGIMVRDFVMSPKTLLTGYAWENIPLPKGFAFDERDGLYLAPMALFVLMFAVVSSDSPVLSKWRERLVLPLMVAAGVAFAGYLSMGFVPKVATHVSSRYALESYERFRTGDEPLGLFGPAKFVSAGEPLQTEGDVVTWLLKTERVFALFPPKNFAPINQLMRAATGRNLNLLDTESDKFYLAVSVPAEGEENQNPIAHSVRSSPHPLGQAAPLEVNFNDIISLLGWEIRGPGGGKDLVAGRTATFTTYWSCKGKVSRDYKIFIHIDGPGGRIHGDHVPLDGVYSTSHWSPGDFVRDVYKLKTRRFQKAGTYRIRLGMYAGSKRLRVKDFASARENAIPLGKVEVR